MAGQLLLRRLPCGAHCRSTGKPCRMTRVLGRRRCRLHGAAPGSGMRTPEGIQRAVEALSVIGKLIGSPRLWRSPEGRNVTARLVASPTGAGGYGGGQT